MKCGQCGSKKHDTNYCSTDLADLTKAKCFACGNFGHIRANCRDKNKEKGKGKQGSVAVSDVALFDVAESAACIS